MDLVNDISRVRNVFFVILCVKSEERVSVWIKKHFKGRKIADALMFTEFTGFCLSEGGYHGV